MLSVTIESNERAREQERRQDLCAKVANLVSNFCVEMMAYRLKWNALYKKAEGKEIDSFKRIELGATTEDPRRLFFELETILKQIPEAEKLIYVVKSVLEGNITKKSVSETEELMDEVREQARSFIAQYTNEHRKAKRKKVK